MHSFHRLKKRASRKSKILILREEKDRFDAMRAIQHETRRFKRYFALSMSALAFGLLWCVGAVVFFLVEHRAQGLSYFQSLYFCYVSLLTIGYGDLAPKSNAGKPFFVTWSLVAVPTMTILVSDMGDTIIASYKRGTFKVGDWTVLPKKGFFREFLEAHPRLMGWLQRRLDERAKRRRIRQGFPLVTREETVTVAPTLEQLAEDHELDDHDLARRLTQAIRRTAHDFKLHSKHRYSYEEWVEYTRLIRFTKYDRHVHEQLDEKEQEDGLIEWDWIGADSPMTSSLSEVEWVLDRLIESLDRYMHRQVPDHVKERRKSEARERRNSRQLSVGPERPLKPLPQRMPDRYASSLGGMRMQR